MTIKTLITVVLCSKLLTFAMANNDCKASNCPIEPFEKPVFDGKKYSNPKSFNSPPKVTAWNVAQWLWFGEDDSKLPSDDILERELPVQKPNFEVKSELQATWLGHSTVLVQMDGLTFVTDPIWADRASPAKFVGPKRYRPTPCKIEDLPKLDFIVISHNHYDHLDEETVTALSNRFPSAKWFVPVGLKEFMTRQGVASGLVFELSWGEHIHVNIDGINFNIWCTPARHHSRRWIFDGNKSLWSGWAVLGPKHRFFYTGDTGFCENEFRKVGKNLGPFDLSAIPIGAYKPRNIMEDQHINPQEAVWIHQLVKSKKSLAVHWGTYQMGSNEGYLEPRDQLQHDLVKEGVLLSDFFTLKHGQTWAKEKEGDK